MKNRLWVLSVFGVIGLNLFSFAQKKQDYTVVVAELSGRLEASASTKVPVRIAIVPFTTLVPENQNRFGEYLTESITGKLLEKPHQFKVFERSRLDAIFKENELMLSGMMKTSEAIKIGQLLSVDALFSGTYTKLKSYIDISGRLIDVASGEILITYSGRIKMNKNLAQLFSPAIATQQTNTIAPASGNSQNTTINIYNGNGTPTSNAAEECNVRDKQMQARTEDMTSDEKINRLVADAISFPFENDCGKFHYSLMGRLLRYKTRPEAYYTFLTKTLQGISFPSRDDRALSIIEFLTYDGTSDEEWKTILETINRTEGWVYRYISYAFSKSELAGEETNRNRIDAFMRDVFKRTGSNPEISFNQLFFQCMQGLGNKNHTLQLYLYEKYASSITADDGKSTANHYLYLNRMYEHEKDAAIKTKIISWVSNYFIQFPTKKSAEQLFEFAYQFDPETPQEYNKKAVEEKNLEKAVQFPINDLQLLIEKCRPLFTQYATQTEYESTREQRINFCLKYNIDVPGAIPTMSEAEQILKGNDFEDQVRILKLLVQMGNKPKSLENILVNTLSKRSLDQKESLQEVQNYCIEVLGNIQTDNPRAITKMIENLKSYNYKEADNSQEALVKIGKAAMKPLMDRLSTTTAQEGGLQYKLIVILGRLGSVAKPSEPMLKKIYNETRNSDIRYAIEAAIQNFQ